MGPVQPPVANDMARITPPQSPAPNLLPGPAKRYVSRSVKNLEEDWGAAQRDSRFATTFDIKVKGLHDKIFQEVENALSLKSETTRHQTLAEIAQFISGDGDEKLEDARNSGYKNSASSIDDCVRWGILYTAAGRIDKPEVEVRIMDMILRKSPYLAFENVNMAPIKDSCPKELAAKHSDCADLKNEKSTPFHKAAKLDNSEAIACLIGGIRRHCELMATNKAPPRAQPPWFRPPDDAAARDSLLNIAQQLDPDTEQSALQLAVMSRDGQAKALGHLITTIPKIVYDNELAFEKVLDMGRLAYVDKFLQHQDAHTLFARGEYINRAMKKIENEDPEDTRVKIVLALIRLARKHEPQQFDLDVAEYVIERNLQVIWKEITSGIEKLPPCVLHIAVCYQNHDIVRQLVESHSEFVTEKVTLPRPEKTNKKAKKEDEHYPLWYNNRRWENSDWNKYPERPKSGENRFKIRSDIVTHTVKRVHKMQDLSDIFEKSEEEARELCFDLSHFNSQSYLVSDFVQSLIRHRENEELLKYEETLRYAEFPALDMNPLDKDEVRANIYLETKHSEVFDVLGWLWGKGVQKIISLKVPDRLVNPHDERQIAESVKQFKVEVLDWRFIDMSISVFEVDVKKNITELHLYASGKRSAISHWMSDEGLISLPELVKLEISVIKETGNPSFCQDTFRDIHENLKTLKFPKLKKENIVIDLRSWNRMPKLDNLDEIAKRVAPKLSKFIESYRVVAYKRHMGKLNPKGFQPTKVAIIDNGILGISSRAQDGLTMDMAGYQDEKGPGDLLAESQETKPKDASERASKKTDEERANFLANKSVWSRIKEGRSFVDENFKLSPWLFASNSHGTQMANLICAIDPLCELYVAKVADGPQGMTSERVARAISWARSKHVDIISMSFTILSPTEPQELADEMSAADKDGIVTICSAHDEGSKVGEAWPADHAAPTKLKIAACDEFGRLLQKTEQFDFKVRGQNVAAGVIPFLEPNERVTGSSVSTALVAGLSSLILSCDRLADPEAESVYQTKSQARINSIKRKLEWMQSKAESRYVLLEKFAMMDGRFTVAQKVDAREIIADWNKPDTWVPKK